jgi:hypothetical protein
MSRADRTANSDTTLLVLCQFAATRLDAPLVGISLLGRRDQYNLAESAQSLELDGGNTDKETEDTHWLGIAEVCVTFLGRRFREDISDSRVRGVGIASFVRGLFKHKRWMLLQCPCMASQISGWRQIFKTSPV